MYLFIAILITDNFQSKPKMSPSNKRVRSELIALSYRSAKLELLFRESHAIACLSLHTEYEKVVQEATDNSSRLESELVGWSARVNRSQRVLHFVLICRRRRNPLLV